jgi:hypothetical protein
MGKLALTPFEQEVMRMLLDGDDAALTILSLQFTAAEVKSRELTGAGFFIEFEVPSSFTPVAGRSSFSFGDVAAEIEGLDHGAGFDLHVRDGVLDYLEGYSHDGPWPTTVQRFKLSYIWYAVVEGPHRLSGGRPSPKRDLAVLKLSIG